MHVSWKRKIVTESRLAICQIRDNFAEKESRNPKDDTESKPSGFSKKKKNITGNDCRDKKAGWEESKQVSTVLKASVLFLRKSIKSACERTIPWQTVHAYWTMVWAKIIRRKADRFIKKRQNAYKEKDQNIIIRWKGGKMKVDTVSQCPSR